MLQLLPYEKINKKKWDACIIEAPNGLIYGLSSYLDALSPNWKGIVLNDYEAVMPLTWKRKWNIPYLYQPAFYQQGGVFSRMELNEPITDAFLQLAAEHFQYASITLNYANPIPRMADGKTGLRNNYLVSLDDSLPGFTGKNDYLQKRFRRAMKNKLEYRPDSDHTAAIKMYRTLYGSRLPAFKKSDYEAFDHICARFSKEKNIVIRKVLNENETVALVLLLRFKDRWYNMISCITENGKKLLANYYLYGMLLEELGEKNQWLDLEGSDVAGIKFFYEKMSDVNQPYPFLSYNRLPKMVRLFKK